MAHFVDVAGLNEIPAGCGVVYKIADNHVAVFRIDDRLFAIDDRCIRCTASLAAGELTGTTLSCRCGWRYDLNTGCLNAIPGLYTDTFEVDVSDSRVRVASACKPQARVR